MSRLTVPGRQKILSPVGLVRLLPVFALTMMIYPALADAQFRLYKTYDFGLTREALLQDSRVYDCSNDVGEEGWLCLDDQTFGNTDVAIGFYFLDNSLVRVALFTEFSQSSYVDMFTTLLSRFAPLYLSSPEGTFDILARMKKVREATLMREMANFERQGLEIGLLTYGFIEKEVFEEYRGKANNAIELIRIMHEHARLVEMYIEEASPTESYMTVRFEAPRLFVKIFEEKMLEKKEEF